MSLSSLVRAFVLGFRRGLRRARAIPARRPALASVRAWYARPDRYARTRPTVRPLLP